MPKVKIDQKAPGFTLPDFEGHPYVLADRIGKKNLLLVFNRGFV